MTIFRPTPEQVAVILASHRKWLWGETGGTRADLTGADLTGADLTRANLTGANLTGANLTGANLTGADLTRANLTRANLTDAKLTGANLTGANLTGANLTGAVIPEGIRWEEYLSGVVPSLLTAGGKDIAALVGARAWECHTWRNCPMAEAFSVGDPCDVPVLLRPRAAEFVRYFDSGLIPAPRQLPDGTWTCVPADPVAAT